MEDEKENQITTKDKTKLLDQLSLLGIDPKSGRKGRSDKGQVRGPNSRPRSDIGLTHQYYTDKPAMKSYLIVKSRLLKRTPISEDEALGLDHNNIFIVIKRQNKIVNKYNQVIHRGQALHRTVRHVKQDDLDLERLRFAALQESLFENLSNKDKENFRQELTLIPDIECPIFLDIFCALYHVSLEDAPRWSYKDWRIMYGLVCDNVLQSDFVFNYNERPGTKEFDMKYGDEIALMNEARLIEFTKTKAYINEHAYQRDYLLSKEKEWQRRELLKDPASATWGIRKLAREINKRIDLSVIDKQVDDYMRVWSCKQLGIKE